MRLSSTLKAFFLVIFVWWVAYKLVNDSFLLPSPFSVFQYLFNVALETDFWKAIGITLLRVIEGSLLALAIGGFLGALAGKVGAFYPILRALMGLIQVLPPVSWILLAMVWMGVGGGPPILAMVLGLLPVVFYNIAEGVRALSREYLEVLKVFQVSFLKAVRKVYIPAMLPFILSALSYSFGTAWKICITAELLASSRGIGARMGWARLTFDTLELMTWTLTILFIGVVVELVLQKLVRKAWYA